LEQKLVAGTAGGVAGAAFFVAEDGEFHSGVVEDFAEGAGDFLGAGVERACAADPEEDFGGAAFRLEFGCCFDKQFFGQDLQDLQDLQDSVF